MFGEKVNAQGLAAWTMAAFFAPAAHFLGSLPWIWVLGGAAAAGGISCLAWNQKGDCPKVWAGVLLICTVPALMLALRYSGACWPGVPDEIQGWALLVFSVWAALRGSAAGTRYGAVVFSLSALVYGGLLICAIPGVRPENLRPAAGMAAPWPLVFLLLPLGLGVFPKEGTTRPWSRTIFGGLGAAALAAICAGCLSGPRAAATDGAFYTVVRGIRLFGVAERFEAVISGVMTMGWFCYMTLILAMAGEAGERLRPRGGVQAALGVAIAASILQQIV